MTHKNAAPAAFFYARFYINSVDIYIKETFRGITGDEATLELQRECVVRWRASSNGYEARWELRLIRNRKSF